MKKTKKLFAIALVLVLSASVLAGCGSDGNTTGPDASTSAGADTNAATGDIPELTWWTIGGEPKELAEVNAKISEYAADKIGATVKLQYSNWGDYSQKLTTIIQSGENYDIAFGSSVSNYINFVQRDYFADLSSLLPDKAPALYEFIPEALWKAMTFKDKLFGVPTYKDSSAAQYWVWEKSLVEQLDIDYKSIVSLEDLEPALKKIRENDPGRYPLPLFGTEGLNGFFSEYDEILAKPLLSVKYDDTSATVVNPFTQPDVMEKLKLLHKWLQEGLINPDAATLTEAPKYRAVFSAQGYPGADADWAVSQGFEVVSNKRYGPVYSTSSIHGSFNVISAGSKNIEKSIGLIELANTDSDFRNLLAFGIEGKHYEKTGENTINVLNDGYQTPAYSQATFFNMYVVDPSPGDKWELVKEQNEQAVSSPILGFIFDPSNVNNQIAACANVRDKYFALIMTGTANPEESVPQMNAELENAGLNDIIEEMQSQVDSFLGK